MATHPILEYRPQGRVPLPVDAPDCGLIAAVADSRPLASGGGPHHAGHALLDIVIAVKHDAAFRPQGIALVHHAVEGSGMDEFAIREFVR